MTCACLCLEKCSFSEHFFHLREKANKKKHVSVLLVTHVMTRLLKLEADIKQLSFMCSVWFSTISE